MKNIREEMITLAKRAQQLHLSEKKANLESCRLIAKLEQLNASVNLGYTKEAFAEAIGLSIEVYWKRAQAGRTMQYFPKLDEMVQAGELQLSHVNIIAPKITQANAEILLEKVKGKTTREVQFAVASVTPNGDIVAQEPEVELRLTFKKSDLERLERAIDVLSSHGKAPSKVDAIVAGLEALLDKRDPVRKAERAAKRKEKAKKMEQDMTPDRRQGFEDVKFDGLSVPMNAPDRRQEIEQANADSTNKDGRQNIPAKIKHEIFRRDKGQCTYVDHKGRRCPERRMLELDHLKMKCRGGDESVENLVIRCRYHNQALAKQILGRSELRPRS